MKTKSILVGIMFSMTFIASSQEKLAPWKNGELEFHVICTGRGESNLMIMPDGTSMLIDAGDWNDLSDEMAPAMPDSRHRPGEWIKRYVMRHNPNGREVDYLMVSHFHNDHTGDTQVKGVPKTRDKERNYIITGITEVGQEIRFSKVFDRGFPTYDYPLPINDPDVDNLRIFYENESRDHGLVMERFKVGEYNQIALRHDADRFENIFGIRNLASSGEIWLGADRGTLKCYDRNPDNIAGRIDENTNSIAIRVDYGPFSLYTGGDLTGSLKNESGERENLEDMVGKCCGNVDVALLNHHGYRGSTSEEYVRNLDARVWLIPVWDYWHIQPQVMKNIESNTRTEGDPVVFPTHIFYSHRQEFGDEPWFRLLSPEYGHVVVKVAPGGESYMVYVVDAGDEEMRVLAKYGPYRSGDHPAK